MPFAEALNEQAEVNSKRLGKLPAKSSLKQLHFAPLIKPVAPTPPSVVNFWVRQAPFVARSYGNQSNGCCVRASQAVAATRMERLEQNRTVQFTASEILRVYYNMTERLYGGGDTGAYEVDGLSEWRKPDLTFRDADGMPHTIDAFLKINHTDVNEVKRAIAFSGVHGIKVCFALPLAWSKVNPPTTWDIPKNQPMIGQWLPGGWGGHSTFCTAYDTVGPFIAHTWYEGGKEVYYGLQRVTWRAFLAYADEANLVVDSIDSWLHQGLLTPNQAGAITEAVNSVSDQKIQ